MTKQKLMSKEVGATRIYLLGVVIIAALLISGVLLLKGFSGNKSDVSDTPVAVQSDPSNTDKTDNNTTDKDNQSETNSGSNQSSNTDQQETAVASTGDSSNPDTITATGPVEDFFGLMFGLLTMLGAVYAAWNYRLSHLALNSPSKK